MRPIHLFDITSQHNQWLANRQSLIASNIANANSPGYQGLDLKPFEEVLTTTKLAMTTTRAGHMQPDPPTSAASAEKRFGSSWDVVHSGNSVTVEKELMKAGEVNAEYSLSTSIIKSFHKMLLTSSRAV